MHSGAGYVASSIYILAFLDSMFHPEIATVFFAVPLMFGYLLARHDEYEHMNGRD